MSEEKSLRKEYKQLKHRYHELSELMYTYRCHDVKLLDEFKDEVQKQKDKIQLLKEERSSFVSSTSPDEDGFLAKLNSLNLGIKAEIGRLYMYLESSVLYTKEKGPRFDMEQGKEELCNVLERIRVIECLLCIDAKRVSELT